jgi:hypothetical protein
MVHRRSGSGRPLRGIRRRALVVSLVLLACVLAAVELREPSPSIAASSRASCGVERWAVKTLQDRPRLLPRRDVTLKYLVARPAPESLPDQRLPFERHIFRVVAAVTFVRPETDGDFHVVLTDSAGRTMITEAPRGSCDANATASWRRQIAYARAAVRVCPRASVTGVAFFDFPHGQSGVAANAIELHPILAFRCLTVTTPPVASVGVHLVSITSPIRAGQEATLTVSAPASASCSIVVSYKSGPSHAAGLYPKQVSAARRVSWTWMVGTRTTAGRWPISVSCGSAGSLQTSFVVT